MPEVAAESPGWKFNRIKKSPKKNCFKSYTADGASIQKGPKIAHQMTPKVEWSEGSVREKNGIGDEWPVCCNFSIVTRQIDQLFNQNPTICCNFASFPPGEREKVGHAGSEEGRKENCSKWWDFD